MNEQVVDAEVVDEVPGQELVQASIARPIISPDEAVKAAEELRQLIARVLVKDKHYQQIKGRDVLLKAGAEELAKFFGLACTYSELKTDRDEGKFSAGVKCTVSKMDGRVLAESYGFYDSSERKNATPNTVVKMAQKRAYVGAVMSATGTSELFTQDLDDNDQTAPGVLPWQMGDERMPSDAELDQLIILYARKGGMQIGEAEDWFQSQPQVKRDSRIWVGLRVLQLLTKPDKPLQQTIEELAPTHSEPELPTGVEPGGEEVNPDDNIPF